jgi:peptide/nickel transport system ATP-binding protein
MLVESVPGLTPPARKPVAAAEIALSVAGLTKTYESRGWFGRGRTVEAARGIDLTVRRGETLGVVGESGAGKSTLARCIVRLIEPSSGHIVIDGHDIARLGQGALRPLRRHVQIVFQDPYRSLNPRRSVGEAIIEGPMNFGLARPRAVARARELMEVVGLSPDALARFPHQFSGGERQRICIARALAMEPRVLIADEPLSALDVTVQAQVLRLLDDVRRRFRLAILFITHDLRVAAQVCDRIMVMRDGMVVEEGETAAVYAAPKHDYTRSLLAAAPGRRAAFAKG